MKLEISVGEASEAHAALAEIDGNASIDMSWAIDDIKEVLEKYNVRLNEEKKRLLEKYGEKGLNSYSLKAKNVSEFNEEFDKARNIKVEIDFEPLDYDIVVRQNIQLPISGARILRKFIVKNKPKEQKKEKEPERKLQPHKKPALVTEQAEPERKQKA